MLELTAKLQFDPVAFTTKQKKWHWKRTVLANTDCDIAEYYANFLEKRFGIKINSPIRGSHITIINDKIENVELYEEGKKFFNGTEVKFQYDPANIRISKDYIWLNVESDDVGNIREALGLSRDYFYKLHITLGTINPKYAHYIDYILANIKRFDI